MKDTNKYKTESNTAGIPTLESSAEAWCRLCLFLIRQEKQVDNQYKDKKYENESKTI